MVDRLPQEFINDVRAGENPTKRYYVMRYKPWKNVIPMPVCDMKSSLGLAGDIHSETLRLLSQFDIPQEEFQEKTLASLAVFEKDVDPATKEWRIPQAELARRTDLREKRIFSIDPETAKDLDDALSIEQTQESGVFRVGVHIADVSYFVEQGSELD